MSGLDAAIQRNRKREQAKRDAIARRDARIAAYLAEPCCRCQAAPCACPSTCPACGRPGIPAGHVCGRCDWED